MKARKNLLIVDDEPEILNFLAIMFEDNSYGVEMAESGDHAMAILERMDIDVMISDIRMPRMDGIELMKKAKQCNTDLQYIFMSGHSDVDTAVLAMQEGALNFLMKPVDFDCLEMTVSQAIMRKEMQREIEAKNRELAHYNEQLEERLTSRTRALENTNKKLKKEIAARKEAELASRHQAYHDLLTGLPNRLLFQDRIDQTLRQARRKKEGFALLMMDLNDFKNVNDTLGHGVGDSLLQEVGQRLTVSLRRGDTVARMGGDEFTMILPEISSRQHAQTVIAKIEQQLIQPMQIKDNTLLISASIGTAIFPDDGGEAETLLNKADQEMYREKSRKKSLGMQGPLCHHPRVDFFKSD